MIGSWYRWAWSKYPRESWDRPGGRKGQRCRLLAVGAKNSALVEFEDGQRFVTSRYGLRRKPC